MDSSLRALKVSDVRNSGGVTERKVFKCN